MLKLAVLAIVFISAQATAEVCVENDTNLPEDGLSYGFIPEGQLNLKNNSHPTLTLPPNFQFKKLGKGDDNCVEFFESEVKGTPGYLVILPWVASSSDQSFTNEDIAYISNREATAPSSSTLMLAIQSRSASGQASRVTVGSRLGNDKTDTFTVTKVFIPSTH